MDRVPAPPAGVTSQPVFVDGFGARYETVDAESGDPDDLVEVLAFAPPLVEASDFGTTLGIRVARLASIQHALFAHARRLDQPSDDSLLLVSDRVRGWRLADVLDVAERNGLTFEIGAVMNLMGQLIPTVAKFAQHQRELAVGTIGPEHLILTPEGRLVVTEYVLGSAIEKLSLSRDVLWRQFRVASTPGPTKIWTRSDVLSIGIVCLSLLHGRRLREAEFPDGLGDLLEAVEEARGSGAPPLSPKLAAWASRALQLEAQRGFQTPADAKLAFEELLANERELSPTRRALDAFIDEYKAVLEPPPSPSSDAPSLIDVEALVSSVVISAPQPEFEPEPEPELEPEPEPVKPALPPPPPRTPATPVVVTKPRVPERKKPADSEPAPAAPPVAEPISVAGSRFPIDLREWRGKALAAFALAALEFIAILWLWNRSSASLGGDGELVVQSRPTGAAVTVDDKDLGTTPVTVRLSPGTYTLKVQTGGGEPRVIPIQIKPGVQTAQYLELRGDR